MRLRWTLLLALGAPLAAGTQGGKMDPQATAAVEPSGTGSWAVTATRTHQGSSGTGRVVVRSESRPDAAQPPHLHLAGARAWLALGRSAVDARDWPRAAAAADRGLAELGTDYAPPKVDDSTDLKVRAARELLDAGRSEDGTRLLLNMLEARAALYVQRHQKTVVE
jgi:hypothetical protein